MSRYLYPTLSNLHQTPDTKHTLLNIQSALTNAMGRYQQLVILPVSLIVPVGINIYCNENTGESHLHHLMASLQQRINDSAGGHHEKGQIAGVWESNITTRPARYELCLLLNQTWMQSHPDSYSCFTTRIQESWRSTLGLSSSLDSYPASGLVSTLKAEAVSINQRQDFLLVQKQLSHVYKQIINHLMLDKPVVTGHSLGCGVFKPEVKPY
ncbi:hypothetical protein [Vibrio crassostreae]|uniref:hypothetical protein n=1 Tax=Vibrio crassostreae TaxID=246167 RepID=UPI001052B2C7|nr:hypothetical protein [Vibrio crassostreae]TCT61642.1 hypothetical protein EDB31_13827 [Vibrio crassostreae]